MSIFLTLLIGISSILLSKYLFRKWFNHLAIYTFIWMSMITFYEMKLIRFVPLSGETWVVITFAFFAYLLGIVTVFTARSTFGKSNDPFYEEKIIISLFKDDGRIIKYLIIIFSIIGILSALQHWSVLIKEFGSIIAVLVKANLAYRMRVEGDLKGVVPYLFILSFVGVFLSGIYTAYKNKITFISILPILAVILKEMANISRAGILFGFFLFVFSFFLFRQLLRKEPGKYGETNKVKVFIAVLLILILMGSGAMLIKTFRQPIDDFQASSRELSQFEGGAFISPSIYLYSCSHLGVLNKYLEHQVEDPYIGENTFLPVYNFLSKFQVVPELSFFQKGYFIPMWTNTGTYLREIDADFGKFGLLSIPFLLGIVTTFFWFRFYEKHKIIDLLILTYLYLIISFSFLVMVTRLSSWFISLMILLVLLPLIEMGVTALSSRNSGGLDISEKGIDAEFE